jgi:S1-C subfamily serine protease
MIVSGIFTYMIFVRQEVNYNNLDNKITNLRLETHNSINSISTSLLDTKEEVNSLNSEFGIIGKEFDLLKASAGEDFSGIIEDAIKSVVTIRTDISQGTGFIISTEGYVVTNYHVVEDAQAATIISSDTQEHAVSLIGYDDEWDLALLKIEGDYNKLIFENSDNVNVGEKIIVIGNPLGLQFSVSQGIVSATHREGLNGFEAYIQIDAALNPGNSGGPLINTEGKVIGINNFKVGDSESLGFALESNFIKDEINEIALEALNRTLI